MTEKLTPQEAAHILMQAEEIKKNPTLMAGVADVMNAKKKDVKKILSLKELRQKANERSRAIESEKDGTPAHENAESKSEESSEGPEDSEEEVDMSGGVPAAGYDEKKEKAIASSLSKKMASV